MGPCHGDECQPVMNEPQCLGRVYEHAPAAAQRMPDQEEFQKARVPRPPRLGPPLSRARLPGALPRRLGHQPPGSWNSQAGCAQALAHTVLCKRSYLIATQNLTLGQLKYTTAFGFRCFQRQGPVPAPKLEYSANMSCITVGKHILS